LAGAGAVGYFAPTPGSWGSSAGPTAARIDRVAS